MVENLNHQCVVCGEKYHSCDNCGRIKKDTPWRSICDTAKHYQIYLLIRNYQAQVITKHEAQEELKTLNVYKGSYNTWKPGVKKVLDEILSNPNRKQNKLADPANVEDKLEDGSNDNIE